MLLIEGAFDRGVVLFRKRGCFLYGGPTRGEVHHAHNGQDGRFKVHCVLLNMHS